jgi:hypothetical protein
MTLSLRIFLIVGILAFFLIIFLMLRKKNLNLKYTLLWIFAALIMLIVSIYPSVIYSISKIIGIETPVNTVFVIGGIFSLLLILSITVIVSHFNNRIRKLSQTIALLDYKLRKLENLESLESGNKVKG